MHTRMRFSLSAWEGLPAFQAGLFVVTAIFALLVNFGFIALVLVARITCDIVLAVARGSKRKVALEAVLRESLLDILLLLYGLNLAVYAATPSSSIFQSGIDSALWTVLVGLGFLVAKMAVLYRCYRRLVVSKSSVLGKETSRNGSETALLLLILAGILSLIASPRLITGGAKSVIGVLRRQIIPWRL